MTRDVAGDAVATGRHRSPWGRSGRILPIRWGRIGAAVLALVVVLAGLVLVRLRLDESGHQGRTGAPGERRAMTGTAAPDVLTAAPGSPRPHSSAAAGSAAPGVATASPPDGQPGSADGVAGTAVGPPAGRPSATGGPPTARPVGAVLGLSATRVDLGTVDSTWRLDLRGEGTAPVDVVVGRTPSWLAVVADTPRVNPGASVPLVISLNRSAAPVGTLDVSVPVSAANGTGGADLRITARVDGSPRVESATATPNRITRAGCPAPAAAGAAAPVTSAAAGTGGSAATPDPTGATGAGAGADTAAAPVSTDTTTVTVTAVDETGVRSARLTGTFPDGRTLDQPLTLGPATGDRTTWTARLVAQSTGTIAYTAVVTSITGRTAQASGTVAVLPCPA
ncbi:hypothetical protein MXD59_06405 [Frankia sp. Ag45/Mut15]|uniref:Uncharacterized protein n=1 Tax=Frankia umida TaxID=573489 RepID=A0ABT0JW04_9ACTN|nr:hypothetical protein [Frankia umida]MCK9875412.1 hypothetical protein [Frankia umida]